MKLFPLILAPLLSGCLGLAYEYVPIDEFCSATYGQTYRINSFDAYVPSMLYQGEQIDLVWSLDIETRYDSAEPCFQLRVNDFDEDELSKWVYPSDGLIQEEVGPGEYPLIYGFRAFQPGIVDLKIYANQHQLGNWEIQIE